MANRKDTELVRAWNDVCELYPDKSDEWRFQMAVDTYNLANKNDPADHSDLIDALDKASE